MSLIEDRADEDVELIWGATFTESAGDGVSP
ncbi:MAG: hypothetical protein Ct9H300mP28_06310 [Pseudomonadota bacterium]|nr:MAG: hypothetical protein Ct9H300mP28_06310 [Pseudomonadota bacterium]